MSHSDPFAPLELSDDPSSARQTMPWGELAFLLIALTDAVLLAMWWARTHP